jgi:hypothetical protein
LVFGYNLREREAHRVKIRRTTVFWWLSALIPMIAIKAHAYFLHCAPAHLNMIFTLTESGIQGLSFGIPPFFLGCYLCMNKRKYQTEVKCTHVWSGIALNSTVTPTSSMGRPRLYNTREERREAHRCASQKFYNKYVGFLPR